MSGLYCKGISKSFGGVWALKNVSLRFPASGVIAIIGPNGAGKTSLVNVLTGFLKPDAGRFYLGNIEITNKVPYQIARLGIARTFQDMRLIREVPVMDNVLLATSPHRGDYLFRSILGGSTSRQEIANRERARETLRVVGLAEKAEQLAGHLSYGQQKLLTLACCLASNSSIMFFDEPIAGVYPAFASSILALMRQLKNDGKLILFIEHDMTSVRAVADTVIVMDQGNVVAEGPPHDVLQHPATLEAFLR
jgi:ABC-type branched-subunit amino acid transport system ATPase component